MKTLKTLFNKENALLTSSIIFCVVTLGQILYTNTDIRYILFGLIYKITNL
jgi:hypothetical protein